MSFEDDVASAARMRARRQGCTCTPTVEVVELRDGAAAYTTHLKTCALQVRVDARSN